MDIIKAACVMLAIAFLTGLLTSVGDRDEVSTLPAELENQNISSDDVGVSGTMLAEEKNESELSASSTSAPDPFILEKGRSKMAIERQKIEKKVQDAAKIIEAQGEELFPEFRNFSIFIWTIDGTQIVSPGDINGEGKNMRGLKDADGKPIGELFIKTALSEKGEGWIEYNWQKNGSSTPSRKYTFIKNASIGEQSYIIGSDFDVDRYITCRNLENCEYTDRPGNIRIAQLLNPESQDRNLDLNYSVSHSKIEPGEGIESHSMKNPEVYYILEGEGLLYIDGIPVELSKDQIIYVPADSIQAIYNKGNTTLKLLIIDQPGWSEENLEVF